MENSTHPLGESKLMNTAVPNADNVSISYKESFKNRIPIRAPQIGSNTYRLGSFAKSLLEKAQSGSSDLKLSPTTIQTLMNPIQILSRPQKSNNENLTKEKINSKEDTLPKCSAVESAVERKYDEIKTKSPLLRSKTMPSLLNRRETFSPEELTKPVVSPQVTTPLKTILSPEIDTENTTEPLRSPGRSRLVPIPMACDDVTSPVDQNKSASQTQTLANPRMRTFPLLNYENSSEFGVAYRQSNDALSSEIRTNQYTQPSSKQEIFTPKYRNDVRRNSEVAARIPPTLPEQNQNVWPRKYVPGQAPLGVGTQGTPVASHTPVPHFRPPSSGKGKLNLAVKKPVNSWKFRNEIVAGKEYLKMKELGKGGCGTVHLVMEKDTRQLFALKIVNLTGIEETIVQECVNEIQMLEQLRDTDLVIRIFSWEMNPAEKTMKIIMEYGQCDLNQSMKSANSTINRLKYIWERILMIVATIHSRGIVHADLKPANFVWVEDTLKIIDFGIANRLQTDHTSIATLNPKGTMNFISPETIRPDATGKTKISPKSDIWSLGCILYMMVYGKTPFQDITHYVAKINAISLGSVTYPELPPHLQFSGVLDVLQNCFQIDPKSRPTAAELLKHRFIHSI